jgi:DNA-directed RNA polymerase specialized sigma24 family protein
VTDLATIELRRIQHEARRIVLDSLFDGAADVEQVGRRCVLLARLHGCESLREKSQREIARFIGISEAAVSERLKLMRKKLL